MATREEIKLAIIQSQQEKILKKLDSILRLLDPHVKTKSIKFLVSKNGGEKKRGTKMFMLKNDKMDLAIEIVDAEDKPAPVEGVPVWAMSDEALGTLTVAENGMSATFLPAGQPGKAKAQVKADADLGEGVELIFGEFDIEVLPGKAVKIKMSGVVSPQVVEEPVPTEPVV